jgi:hypothetical protein
MKVPQRCAAPPGEENRTYSDVPAVAPDAYQPVMPVAISFRHEFRTLRFLPSGDSLRLGSRRGVKEPNLTRPKGQKHEISRHQANHK